MSLKSNKIFIFFLDFLGRVTFSIPILINSVLSKKNLSPPEKILIIELWGIGDLVIMSSVLKALKDNFPKAEITLLSKPVGKVLFKSPSYIDEVIEFNFPWTRFKGKYKFWNWDWKGIIKVIKKLMREKFDLILDARGDFRNNLLSFLIGGRRRVGYKWTGGGYFLTDTVLFDYRNKHRVEAWIKLLSYLNIKGDDVKPYICVAEDEEKWADEFLRNHNINSEGLVIGIHPGARIKTRCWALDKFAKVAENIRGTYKTKIIIFVEPGGYGESILINTDFIKVDVCLRKLVALIKRLNLLICNDGGAMHIATAVETPTISIFGPTNPVWFGPYGDSNSVVIKENIKCRPCFDYCKYSEPFCLTGISVDEVSGCIDKKILSMINKKIL